MLNNWYVTKVAHETENQYCSWIRFIEGMRASDKLNGTGAPNSANPELEQRRFARPERKLKIDSSLFYHDPKYLLDLNLHCVPNCK